MPEIPLMNVIQQAAQLGARKSGPFPDNTPLAGLEYTGIDQAADLASKYQESLRSGIAEVAENGSGGHLDKKVLENIILADAIITGHNLKEGSKEPTLTSVLGIKEGQPQTVDTLRTNTGYMTGEAAKEKLQSVIINEPGPSTERIGVTLENPRNVYLEAFVDSAKTIGAEVVKSIKQMNQERKSHFAPTDADLAIAYKVCFNPLVDAADAQLTMKQMATKLKDRATLQPPQRLQNELVLLDAANRYDAAQTTFESALLAISQPVGIREKIARRFWGSSQKAQIPGIASEQQPTWSQIDQWKQEFRSQSGPSIDIHQETQDKISSINIRSSKPFIELKNIFNDAFSPKLKVVSPATAPSRPPTLPS